MAVAAVRVMWPCRALFPAAWQCFTCLISSEGYSSPSFLKGSQLVKQRLIQIQHSFVFSSFGIIFFLSVCHYLFIDSKYIFMRQIQVLHFVLVTVLKQKLVWFVLGFFAALFSTAKWVSILNTFIYLQENTYKKSRYPRTNLFSFEHCLLLFKA